MLTCLSFICGAANVELRNQKADELRSSDPIFSNLYFVAANKQKEIGKKMPKRKGNTWFTRWLMPSRNGSLRSSKAKKYKHMIRCWWHILWLFDWLIDWLFEADTAKVTQDCKPRLLCFKFCLALWPWGVASSYYVLCKTSIFEYHLGTKEMDQWVKCLLLKQENLSLHPQNLLGPVARAHDFSAMRVEIGSPELPARQYSEICNLPV